MASAVSHQAAIARASLTAGLLRPDPAPVSRDEISNFHALLEQALSKCSPSNIQNCKRWIMNYMNSRPRFATLGKFLTALSPALTTSTTTTTTTTAAGVGGGNASARRKRVNVLYLVNDLLHHTTYNDLTSDGLFAEVIRPCLPDLFVAAMYPGAVKQLAKLERLLDIWAQKGYYNKAFIDELRNVVKDATSATPIARPRSSLTDSMKAKVSIEKPLLLPPFHGDPSLPFYDLPAANMLPHLTPNLPTPINPRLMKPIQFSTLVPNESLAAAVKDFIKSVDGMFHGDDALIEDPDAIGGGGGEGYFGWSRDFCEKMKQKKRAALKEKQDSRHHRNYSYSPDERGRRVRSTSYYSPSRSRSRDRRRIRDSRRGTGDRERDSRSRSPSSCSNSYHSRSQSLSRSRSRSAERPAFQQQPRTHLNIPLLQETQQYAHQSGYAPPTPPPPPLPPHQQYYQAEPPYPPQAQNWNMLQQAPQHTHYYQQQQSPYHYTSNNALPPPPSAPGTRQAQFPPPPPPAAQGSSQRGYNMDYSHYNANSGGGTGGSRRW